MVSNLHIHASLLDLVGKNLPFSVPKNKRGIFSRKHDESVAMSSPGVERRTNGTAVSVTNHYTGWKTIVLVEKFNQQ
ncbi:hypothetical protein TNCV_2835991 [Trichonephila clavipes]|nr:hypothetical protein TNCV_2835991 [Trichonephila clavipes]